MDTRRKRRAFLLLSLLAFLLFGSITYRHFQEDIRVDECLDVRHGSFDYSRMSCDLARKHPYVPYKHRHPYDEAIALSAIFASMAFGVASRLSRNQQKA
jgi:hypothetical protein